MNTHNWVHPNLEVRNSRIHGKGVFAISPILKGERLAIFGGDIMLIDEINSLPESLEDYPMQIEERFVIGSREERAPETADYFNHSCEPNSGFKGQIFLVAVRKIKKDEEITFDYAMVVSESVGSSIIFEMDCQCGSQLCRKRITENDWKSPVLRRKYKGYFSQYIQEKIEVEKRMDRNKAFSG
jgi:SET domain-containing protein